MNYKKSFCFRNYLTNFFIFSKSNFFLIIQIITFSKILMSVIQSFINFVSLDCPKVLPKHYIQNIINPI